MKKIYTIVSFILVSSLLTAQNKDTQSADKLFKKLEFIAASEAYLKLVDTNNDGDVNETELSAAIAVLEKAKREKQRHAQKAAFSKFNFQKYNYDDK